MTSVKLEAGEFYFYGFEKLVLFGGHWYLLVVNHFFGKSKKKLAFIWQEILYFIIDVSPNMQIKRFGGQTSLHKTNPTETYPIKPKQTNQAETNPNKSTQ